MKTAPDEIVPATPVSEGTKSIPEDPNAPRIGRWYYVRTKHEKDDEGHIRGKRTWLGCVIKLGSNYAKLASVDGGTLRVHFDSFDKKCLPADDALDVIARRIARHKAGVQTLLAEIRDLTQRLGVGAMSKPLPGGETQAISVRGAGSDQAVKEYKTALISAKDKQLPDLFAQVRHENQQLARWMRAETLPLEAEVAGMETALDAIKQRIFSVELYAGLVEDIVEITAPDAPAAPIDTPIHLMQRRCYMDEESLAQYESGGMDYKHISGFYDWLARPVNRDRILPHPRCIVAFRIRRHTKAYEVSLHNFWSVAQEHELNKKTFLFIRNGEKLFCLATQIEFPEQLFPEGEHANFVGKLWLNTYWSRIDAVITEAQYQGLVEGKAAWQRRVDAWEAKSKAQRKADGDSYFSPDLRHEDDPDSYTPFEPSNLYYDDAVEYIQNKVNEHNQLVLVLQGLLDRSPVLHPHPPYQLWRAEGFAQALRLVYDASRALAPSEHPPDFEAYRARLNASITVGTITVGQRTAWRKDPVEARKHEYHKYTYTPGPALLDRVVKVTRKRADRTVQADFRWKRQRSKPLIVVTPVPNRPGYVYKKHTYPGIPTTFTCDVAQLLNVDAYTPGDFKQFFADPRTREAYLKWAPLLLIAEDYHAGKRKLEEEDDD